MRQIVFMACKDCGEEFRYAAEAASRDRREGRSAPERCPQCRPKHSKEYGALGVSHNDVLQLRRDGTGGLAQFVRKRPPPREEAPAPASIEPMPIEEIIGPPETPGTVLHGLLHDTRRVHVVVGPTGSGKSTWLPFRLVTCEALVARGPIVITQPRVPATTGPAEFVAELYYGDKKLLGPGVAIGYRYSDVGTSMTDSANRLVFMTDGTLLNELRSGEVGRYSLIIIDEAHERSVNIDRILSLLRLKLDRFPHLQVMISSATVDATTFETFFGGPGQVAVYEGRGFTYPILDLFADESVAHHPNVWDAAGARDAVWEIVDDATRAREQLGAACWSYRGQPGWQLRHYPAFEALVFQGEMDAATEEALAAAQPGAAWPPAIRELAARSRRRRSVGSGDVGRLESIGGSRQPPRGPGPARVGPDIVKRLVHAVVGEIECVIERDLAEASRRRDRWTRRDRWGELGWDAATGQAWTRLAEPYPVGHVLAFLPTVPAIKECARLVARRLKDRGWDKDTAVLRFFREAPEEEKKRAMAKVGEIDPPELRKIVIGTNLAETSLTLDGLVYVIDSGLICEEYYDRAQGGKSLATVFHSQAGCRQRVGRVGRKAPGEAYRLYTRAELRAQAPYTTPQIARSSPEAVVLDLVQAGVAPDPSAIRSALMSAPPEAEMKQAVVELRRVRAVDDDGDVTARGLELAATPGESLMASQLLSEADRFGVLWEMAVFLAILRLASIKAPGGPWFALWVPTDAAVPDDVGADDEDEEPEPARTPEDAAWSNPYFLGDILAKRLALAEACLDDLELYLRVWQGWFGAGTEEARRDWARAHGVSHGALLRAAEIIGVTETEMAERGTLRAFWDFGQKGLMSRDVDFARLDIVRFLYAAGFPDRIYRRASEHDASFSRLVPVRPSRPASLHRESGWVARVGPRPPLADDSRPRLWCVATAKVTQGTPGGAGKERLRHVVWLSPEWVKAGPPTFELSPAGLARRLMPVADRARAGLGRAPFLDGAVRAGFRWPMPTIPQPTALEIEQWRVRLGPWVEGAVAVPATVAHVVDYPGFLGKPLAFAQVPGGPLVPCDFKGQAPPATGQHIEARLEARDGFLRARAILPAEGSVSSAGASGQPSASASSPVSRGKVVALPKRETAGEASRGAAPVAIPANLVLAGEVMRAEASEARRGLVVRVTQEPYRDLEVFVEAQGPATSAPRAAGSNVVVRTLGEQGGGPVAALLAEPAAGESSPAHSWPVGTRLEGEVVQVHRIAGLCRIDITGADGRPHRWNAVVPPRLSGLGAGSRAWVRITAWKAAGVEAWPHLEVEGPAGPGDGRGGNVRSGRGGSS